MSKRHRSEWSRYVEALVETQYGGVQSDLARALGVSPGTVNRWTNQDAVPRHAVLRKLSEVSGRPINELIAVAYEVDPDDSKLQAQAEAFARKVPVDQLNALLDRLEEAKTSKNISAKEYKSARNAIALAAELQYRLLVTKELGELPGATAAVP